MIPYEECGSSVVECSTWDERVTCSLLFQFSYYILMWGPIAQSVASLIANTGIMSLILAWPHTFEEIDYEIFLQSFSSFKAVVGYKQKYVH